MEGRFEKIDNRKTLLITSATSGVGLAVIDALRNRRSGIRIIGISTEPFAAVRSEFDLAINCPSTESQAFPEFVENICKSEKVDLVIAGRDDDLMALADRNDDQQSRIRLQSGPGSLLTLFRDKYRAYEWCKEHSIEFAESITTDSPQVEKELDRLISISGGYPLVLKPRCGDGSRGVHILRDEEDLRCAILLDNHIIQEFVGNTPPGNVEPNLKFGVPLFWNFPELLQGVIVLIVNRQARTGESFTCIASHSQGVVNKLWRTEDTFLTELANKILKELLAEGFEGICNFSAMKSVDGTWKVIEINSRFTGGTAGRLLLGFDEVGKVLSNFLDLELRSTSRDSSEVNNLIYRKTRDIIN
jgi:carbamoyl-phosphate synthase large subunit